MMNSPTTDIERTAAAMRAQQALSGYDWNAAKSWAEVAPMAKAHWIERAEFHVKQPEKVRG